MKSKSAIRVLAVRWHVCGTGCTCAVFRRWQNDSRWGANYFPNVELTTQDGKVVHFYDDLIKGKDRSH